MKVFKKILLLVITIMLFIPTKSQALSNKVNLYLFYRYDCPHCEALQEALKDIVKEYPELKVYKYETAKSSKNRELMVTAEKALNMTTPYVPFTIIGDKYFIGYSETPSRAEIEYAIKLYMASPSYYDPVGKALGVDYNKGTLTYEDIKKTYEKNNDGETKEKGYVLDVPFIGAISTKDLSLPLISIIIGTIDGFNPCAMWVLIFLISVLIGMKDRKRMWILGSTFLITSALAYLLFMLAWLNLAIFMGSIWWIKLMIAFVSLIGGYLNLRSYIRTKDTGCEVVDEKKRKKIFAKVKAFTSEKRFAIALLGIITLAISVNFIELTCSAGLPVIFTNILALNHLSILEYSFYIFLYLLFFLIDDLVVFFIAMTSLKLTGISNKYAKYSHLIGGIIMLLIGILMIFKPEWLLFNF
jgi:thiol-disulfide isomerase/thioredoxin